MVFLLVSIIKTSTALHYFNVTLVND